MGKSHCWFGQEHLVTFGTIAGLGDDERDRRGSFQGNADPPRRHAFAERPAVKESKIVLTPDLEGCESLVAAGDGIRETNDGLESDCGGSAP